MSSIPSLNRALIRPRPRHPGRVQTPVTPAHRREKGPTFSSIAGKPAAATICPPGHGDLPGGGLKLIRRINMPKTLLDAARAMASRRREARLNHLQDGFPILLGRPSNFSARRQISALRDLPLPPAPVHGSSPPKRTLNKPLPLRTET